MAQSAKLKTQADMLLEVRKLVFSDGLLQEALLAHCKTEDVKIPNSQIQKVRFAGTPGQGGQVVIAFVTSNPKNPYEVHLNEGFVLSAMIALCKQMGVPLPRDAAKTVQLTDQGLAMTVSMKVDPVSPSSQTRAVG